MCGIAGIIDKKSLTQKEEVLDMLSCMKHRGPDALGYYENKHIKLGHVRLSIIDLQEASNQPMISRCGKFVIVFNGEIYNYKDLRKKYQLNCRTQSDTEVILELFKLLGPKHVNELNGMFAYVIYDIEHEKTYIYRDRVGVKPLYYYHDENIFAFASELKALQKIFYVKNKINLNLNAIYTYLHLGYIPKEESIYTEIKKFKSGSFSCLDTISYTNNTYWSIYEHIKVETIPTEQEAIFALENLLESSIKYRLEADVPVGVFLSGGIDSSLVAAFAAKHHATKIKSFTIGFKDAKFDESKYAKKVSNHLGTDHQELIISEKEIFGYIDSIFDIYDEPFADQSMLPSLAVCKMAAEQVKVVLTGDGGDEFFWGYGAYTWAQRLHSGLFKNSKKLLSTILNMGNGRYQRVGELVNYDTLTNIQSHIHSKENGYLSTKEISRLFNLTYNFDYNLCHEKYARKLSPVEKQALFDSQIYLTDDLLVKMDRASMHYSLEAREPLLDYRILEYAVNLSPELKINNKNSKYLLKKILYKYVPKELIDRPKWGFTVPLHHWLNNELSYLKNEYLNENIVRQEGIVPYDFIKKLLKEVEHKPYKIQQVWAMILLHKWLRENK